MPKKTCPRPTLTEPPAPPAPGPASIVPFTGPNPPADPPGPIPRTLAERAFEMRRQSMGYHEIAAELGMPVEQVHAAVAEVWKKTAPSTREPAEMVLDAELATLDALQRRWLPLAVHESLEIVGEPGARQGSPGKVAAEALDAGLKAFDRVLKIGERRAKLLNLETATDGSPKASHLTLRDVAERLRAVGKP